MGHYKVKFSLCSVQLVWWGLHWGLRQGAVQVVGEGCGFAGEWRVPEEEAALGNHSVQSPGSV